MKDYSQTAPNCHNPNSDCLYQTNPWPKEPGIKFTWNTNYSWTSSLESYRNAARRESYCLFHNGRRASHTLQLNLLRYYRIQDVTKLRVELSKLFAYLGRKKSLTAFAALEITRDEFKTGPTDRVHLHFLINTALTEDELINLFHRACKAAKYTTEDYRISKVERIVGIPDDEYKYRYCNYIVKDGLPGRVIMFKSKLFRKIRTVGKWWVVPAHALNC